MRPGPIPNTSIRMGASVVTFAMLAGAHSPARNTTPSTTHPYPVLTLAPARAPVSVETMKTPFFPSVSQPLLVFRMPQVAPPAPAGAVRIPVRAAAPQSTRPRPCRIRGTGGCACNAAATPDGGCRARRPGRPRGSATRLLPRGRNHFYPVLQVLAASGWLKSKRTLDSSQSATSTATGWGFWAERHTMRCPRSRRSPRSMKERGTVSSALGS